MSAAEWISAAVAIGHIERAWNLSREEAGSELGTQLSRGVLPSSTVVALARKSPAL